MHIFDRQIDIGTTSEQSNIDAVQEGYTTVIPTLNARSYLPELLPKLASERTIFIDSSSSDGTAQYLRDAGYTVISIERSTFNHGKTRNLCLDLCTTEFVIFMTQDACPQDDTLFTRLLAPFCDEAIAATYARQIPRKDASLLEILDRQFKYPNKSEIQSLETRDLLGARTYFMSNSCAAYRMSIFRALGGFIETEIMGEDALYAFKAISQGYRIAYVSEATVIHSHSYSLLQRLRRYFDTGVYRSNNKDSNSHQLGKKDTGQGMRYIHQIAAKLIAQKHYGLLLKFGINSAISLLGYKLGKRYHFLPHASRRWLSMNTSYWQQIKSFSK